MKPEPHFNEHLASAEARGDRIRARPQTLRTMLKWAWSTYKQEPPARLHELDLMGLDGNPRMTSQAEGWLNLTPARNDKEWAKPDNWREVACRVADGCYITPMRCAIEATLDERDRMILRAVVVNVLTPEGICDLFAIHPDDYNDVVFAKLDRLYTRYLDRPLPQRERKSESQSKAEAEGDAA